MTAPQTIALWQQPSLIGQPDAMIDRLAALLTSGAAGEAGLIILPELWTSGYNDPAAVIAASEPADGPWQTRLTELARAHRIALAYGYPESDGAHRYNAARLIDETGQTLAAYRKINLWGDYERGLFTPGTVPSAVAEWRGWRIGLSICYDTEFPETIRDLALRGADLVIAPTACGCEFPLVADAVIRVRALENGMYLAFANRVGSECGYAFDGRSAIVGPDGVFRDRASSDEALLFATLDKAAITAARAHSGFLRELRWGAPRLA